MKLVDRPRYALSVLVLLADFFTSGLVHFSWRDCEVAIIFYFTEGMGLALERRVLAGSGESPSVTFRV